LSEIAVLGEEDTIVLFSDSYNIFIRKSTKFFQNGPNVVPLEPERSDNAHVHTFVGEEAHESAKWTTDD